MRKTLDSATVAKSPTARKVMEVLRHAAASGAPCPNNAAIAREAQRNLSSTQNALLALVEVGAVVLERDGDRRRITIVAEGIATAWGCWIKRNPVTVITERVVTTPIATQLAAFDQAMRAAQGRFENMRAREVLRAGPRTRPLNHSPMGCSAA